MEVIERWRNIYRGPDVIQCFIDGDVPYLPYLAITNKSSQQKFPKARMY